MHHNPELELAWNFVEKTNKNIFLTGKAGTGKTTFLHKIREKSFKRLVVVAPTGVAAINAKGVTIHSFFQMSFGPILPPEADSIANQQHRHNNTKFQKKFNKKKIDIIRSLDLLIIDEVSMVRADLLDGIDQVLRRYRDRDKVFGGVQLLMIGDLQQLAPVVKNDEWRLLSPYYDTAFFFSSKAFRESAAVGIELKHIYRQDNAVFIGILNEIRNNKLSAKSLETLNQRYQPDFRPKEDDGYITLTTHNNRANKMNLQELESIDRKSRFFTASIDGDFPEHAYPTMEELEFKVGAQVMFIKNDSSPEKRFYNGKIGKIVQMNSSEIVVRCPGDDNDITTKKESWENLKYSIDEQTKDITEKVKGSFNQMPLRLAWSITIHKSQGLTFERAIIDAESSFAHGQTYVALSRCTTLEGIVLKSKIGMNGIIQDTRVIGFTQDVEEKSPDQKQLLQAKNNYQLQLIDEIFRFPNLGYLVNRCLKVEFQNSNILKGNILEPLKIIKEKGVQELSKVADSFRNQLSQMNTANLDPESNEEIQERFIKAINYFKKQTEEFLMKPLSEVTFMTDNATVEKDFKEPLTKMNELFNIKRYCFNGLSEGFNATRFLELRAQAVFQKEKTKVKNKITTQDTQHPELFNALRQLRNDLVEEEDVAHFQIYTQKALLGMCESLPRTKKQLLEVNGIGQIKVDKYGNQIIEIIKGYCKAQNISETFEQIDINLSIAPANTKEEKKPKVLKGDSKKLSLNLFKEGISIKEIAEERGLTMGTIENHLISFIVSGEIKTEDLMPKEKADALKKLIKNMTYKSLTDLKKQLSDKFSYNELRMVVDGINGAVNSE